MADMETTSEKSEERGRRMTNRRTSLSDMTERERVTLLNYLEVYVLPDLVDQFHCDEKCNDQNEMKITANKIEELEKIMAKLKI